MDTGQSLPVSAEAPFDREDTTLNPTTGACVTCPRRSGFNTNLFHDVQGDQCLDAPCYQVKVTAHIDREIAARPHLVQLETAWRKPTDQRPGALQKHQYRELDTPDNTDAEPPCPHTKAAIIVFGRNLGKTVAVCTDTECPVDHPRTAAQRAADPPPVRPSPPECETEEEAEAREAEFQQRQQEYKVEQERKEKERQQEFDRQQKEYEAEQSRRDKQRKAGLATFDRILASAPPTFSAAQLRVFLAALVNLDPYEFAEDVAEFYVGENENHQQTTEEVLAVTLASLPDEKLTEFALRLVLTGHTDVPRENDPDFLIQAEAVFAAQQPNRKTPVKKTQPVKAVVKSKAKSETPPKKKLAA